MAPKHSRSPALKAADASLINLPHPYQHLCTLPLYQLGGGTYVWSIHCRAAAYLDRILLTSSGTVGIIPATDTSRIEDVIKVSILEREPSLNSTAACRLKNSLFRGCTGRNFCRRGRHGELVEVAPEAAKRHDVPRRRGNKVRINRIVWATDFRGDPSRSQVFPSSDVHGFGTGHSDGTDLGSKGRDGIVEIVVTVNGAVDIRGPNILSVSPTKRREVGGLPFRPSRAILLPAGIAEPWRVHGPDKLGAEATLTLLPVEKRK